MLACIVSANVLQSKAVTANPLFSDNAVLQRGQPIPVFGTGTSGETVTVRLGDAERTTKVSSDGKWEVRFPSRSAGENLVLAINGTVVARNLVLGEVWVASGQSNMEWPLAATNAQFAEGQRAAKPSVRMFTVTKAAVMTPAETVQGSGWISATAGTVGQFSAVGFWFAERLSRELNVPVGVIHTSWGGTPAESWTSRDGLSKVRTYADAFASFERFMKQDFQAAQADYQRKLAEYNEGASDTGNQGEVNGWHKPDFADSDWKTVRIPTTVEAAEGRAVDGAFWFRKEFIWDGDTSGDFELQLGAIDDFDVTYLNGVKVGSTGAEVPNHWMHIRKYRGSGALRAGRNVVAIRVYDTGQGGGISATDAPLQISAAGKTVSLAGTAKFRSERIARTGGAPSAPYGPGNAWTPMSLYNGMIAPLIPYGIRGAIWYQGEANAGRAFQYRELFPAMIKDWRNHWKQGDFPFHFVQLANFQRRSEIPAESGWAELREAQAMTLKLRNTGMATAIDIGERNDIHPRNKKDVGYRLAGVSLKQDYKRQVLAYGPMYSRMVVRDGEIRLRFNYADGLKTSDGKAPARFAIAGADRKFVWASARIDGSEIVVTVPSGMKVVAVRYGWDDDPETNVFNSANLPMFPFRTDDFPGITLNSR
jgi:sialate O-acetylesterase